MRSPEGLLLCFGLVTFLSGQNKPPLTNDDILKLLRAGFSETVLLEAIEVNQQQFDVSPQALVTLKEAGVAEKVISAILTKAQSQDALREQDLTHLVPGVYAKSDSNYVEVEPDVLNWSPRRPVYRGFLGKRPIPVELVAVVVGSRSRMTLTPNVEFLIVCPEPVPDCEYQLLMADERAAYPDTRDFLIKLLFDRRSVQALEGAKKVPFEREQIFARGFRIRPVTLSKGEYGFLPPGVVDGTGSNGKIYTFTIP